MDDIEFLLCLAKKTQMHGKIETSTIEIAKECDVSQQTISRKLQEFAIINLIEKTATPNGVTISLTDNGKEQLQKFYGQLHSLFSKQLLLKGIVKEGLGEGTFYMSQEEYKKQLQTCLGFIPYLGTLNVAVNKNTVVSFLAVKQLHLIKGFQTKERTFGGLKCFPILIQHKKQEHQAAIIIPDRTIHTLDTIEIIAPIYLRTALQLKDGDEINLI
ncbi:MAG: DUF120 domain-containing protein [Candidatus Woesearchaeota archaeon]|jgi:riboflavin kinase